MPPTRGVFYERHGQRMTCNFVQIRADLAKTPEAAAAEVEKQLQEVTPRQMTQVCKVQRQEMADLAAQVATTQDIAPRPKVFLTDWMQCFQVVGKKPTIESIREYLRYGSQKETKSCRIWANPGQEAQHPETQRYLLRGHGLHAGVKAN